MTQVNSNTGFHSLKEQLRTNQKEKKDEKARASALAPAAVKALEPLEKDAVILAENAGKVAKGADPLLNYPVRALAYTNEVGAALADKTLLYLSYIPALLYFGADIYDKYKSGENGTYQKPSLSKGIKQAVFQGLASVALPTGAIMAIEMLAEKACKMVKLGKKTSYAIKIATGFATLFAVAKPIDKLVEHTIIDKYLGPIIDKHFKK